MNAQEYVTSEELVLAETYVDWAQVDTHITSRRMAVERMLVRPSLDYAASLDQWGIPEYHHLSTMQSRLFVALGKSYIFGHRKALSEIRALRSARTVNPVLATSAGDPPVYPELANRWLRQITVDALSQFVQRMNGYYARYMTDLDRLQQLRDRARRMAHNIAIEYVTEALNAGRSLAAMGQDEPTIHMADALALYAMRSERLDRNTCSPCAALHGTVVEVLSSEYLELLPPKGCLGRGRCRGIMVYGDTPEDLMAPISIS